MRYFLSNLHECFPRVLRSELCTITTLSILNQVFNLKNLLKNGRCKNLNEQYFMYGMRVDSNYRTSFCIVNFTFMRLECGSVQIKLASMRRTLLRPFSFFKQRARSSRDSGLAITHAAGGEANFSQFLQKDRLASRDQPSSQHTGNLAKYLVSEFLR